MKCPHCGAPLKMEDKFCTYCGAPNTLAQQHQEDMEHYEREFAETQEKVLDKSRRAGSLAGHLVILFILLVLVLVMGFMNGNIWNIRYEQRKEYANAHAAEHRANLERMIAEKDYIGIRSYYYDNNLSGVETFDEYSAVVSYAGHLGDLYSYLCDKESWKNRLSENSIENAVTTMSSDIIDLYEEAGRSYYREEAITEDKMEIISDIRKQAEALFMTYGGFTAEEVESLPNMSKSRVDALLRKHLSELSGGAVEAAGGGATEETAEEQPESAADTGIDESGKKKTQGTFSNGLTGGDDI